MARVDSGADTTAATGARGRCSKRCPFVPVDLGSRAKQRDPTVPFEEPLQRTQEHDAVRVGRAVVERESGQDEIEVARLQRGVIAIAHHHVRAHGIGPPRRLDHAVRDADPHGVEAEPFQESGGPARAAAEIERASAQCRGPDDAGQVSKGEIVRAWKIQGRVSGRARGIVVYVGEGRRIPSISQVRS